MSFYSLARLGELTVPLEAAFNQDPAGHTQACNVECKTNWDGLPTIGVTLPRSKVTRLPRKTNLLLVAPLLNLSGTPCATCLVAALDAHLQLNNLQGNDALFTYRKANGVRAPLTKRIFLDRLKKVAASAGVAMPHGHAFCIGGTLHYVLKGLPFDAIRVIR
jgi:hypothetical protein